MSWRRPSAWLLLACVLAAGALALGAQTRGGRGGAGGPTILVKAAALLDVHTGEELKPGMVLITGQRIAAVGSNLSAPPGAQTVDLGNLTLLPGLIDCHVHLFLNAAPAGQRADETGQTVRESVPYRTVLATLNARDDLMAGFTSERDMGTEGAGFADAGLKRAIDQGLIPGPRLWISNNAISIVGGHEDTVGYNPALLIPANADLVTGVDELIATIRRQHHEGATFVKIYETGAERMENGEFHATPQFSEAELQAAVEEAARLGTFVGVHDNGEPGTLWAAEAGVASIDHAAQLSDQTMQLVIQKHIFAVPTFTILEYFNSPEGGGRGGDNAALDYKIAQFKRQVAAGVPIAMGSDVGPFPHGTQAKEYYWMVHYGMSPLAAIQAGTLNGAALVRDAQDIGSLDAGKYADIIGVAGDPLGDITVLQAVQFVMKGGQIYKQPATH